MHNTTNITKRVQKTAMIIIKKLINGVVIKLLSRIVFNFMALVKIVGKFETQYVKTDINKQLWEGILRVIDLSYPFSYSAVKSLEFDPAIFLNLL